VRIPAGFCGTFSLKPSPERISYRDCANTVTLSGGFTVVDCGKIDICIGPGADDVSLSSGLDGHLPGRH
jgi:hypothetical protein